MIQVAGMKLNSLQKVCPRCNGLKYDPEIRSKLQPPPGYMPCRDCNGSGIADSFKKLWPDEFISGDFFPTHCKEVFDGVYDVPFERDNPIILDIGANVGALVRWAKVRWPKCIMYCYEPCPSNFKMLQKTVAPYSDVMIYECGVADKDAKQNLIFDGYNCGEWSICRQSGKETIEVRIIDAANLPTADILKIDAEGVEPCILERLCEVGRVREFSAIVYEFHGSQAQLFLQGLLTGAGFKLMGHSFDNAERGVFKWMKR